MLGWVTSPQEVNMISPMESLLLSVAGPHQGPQKTLKNKTSIHRHETEIKKFSHDEKELNIEQLVEMLADHMEFHRMDMDLFFLIHRNQLSW